MNTLVSNMYRLRNSKRFTQTQVANRVGVSAMSYNSYEKARCNPSLNTLIKLADLYDVSLDALVGREGALRIESANECKLNKDQVEIRIDMTLSKYKEKMRREIFKELFDEEF